ncbi:IS1 family transposase [Serratia sp. J2]|uniref:IS1 family transposase n=1 Tax=Serratia sp. J2 TaxID=3386551 RepID=UPI003916D2A7
MLSCACRCGGYCELYEQWNFVGNRTLKHWLWYAEKNRTGGVLGLPFRDETYRELLVMRWPFTAGMITATTEATIAGMY